VDSQKESFVGIILAIIIIFTAAQYQKVRKWCVKCHNCCVFSFTNSSTVSQVSLLVVKEQSLRTMTYIYNEDNNSGYKYSNS